MRIVQCISFYEVEFYRDDAMKLSHIMLSDDNDSDDDAMKPSHDHGEGMT